TPGTIIVDRQVADAEDLSIGDAVQVTFGSGSVAEFTIAAVSDEPTLLGVWAITLEDWVENVPAAADAMVFVLAEDGADLDALGEAIDEVVEPFPMVQADTRDEFLGSVKAQLTAALNIVYGLLALSILIALIGIANTLSLSIHERTR